MNKYQLKMKTPSGLGIEYVYVESYYDNFERFLEEHNIKYKKYDYKTNQDIEIERLNNIIDYTTRYIQDEKRGVKYINDILLILRGEVYLDKNNMLQDINEKR